MPSSTPTRTFTATRTLTRTPTFTQVPVIFSGASFSYDGDGKRVKSVETTSVGTTTTYFVGGHYERTGTDSTYYYFAGSTRIAMRKNGTLYYLLGDHLGSTSIVTDASGNKLSEMRYKAWGEVRYTWGSTPTDYQFTGQYSHQSDFGLMFYNARWYDPYITQFSQPDTIIPDQFNTLDWNRYAYARYNPLRYTDPSGHWPTPINGGGAWAIILSVNLATSDMPVNYFNPNETLYAAQSNHYITGNLSYTHYNLCGDTSLSMILETVTGATDTLESIYSGRPSSAQGDVPTGSYELGQQFANSFPAGWSATAITYGEVATFDGGNPKYTSYVSNSPNGVSNIGSSSELAMYLAYTLQEGSYIIAGVTQNKYGPTLGVRGASRTVGHWTTVTGVSNQFIFINNPYTNGPQKYTWDEFYASWRYSMMIITPPNPRPRPFFTNNVSIPQ